MKYKRRSTRLSISQKNLIQPTSRLPVLNPKLAPKLPDELRKKWIRNPDIGLVVLNDENRPHGNTAKNLSEVIEENEEEDYMDEANELMEPNRPSTSAMPLLRNLSLQDPNRTNDETWLLEEGDVNMESLLELSAEEDQPEPAEPRKSLIRKSLRQSVPNLEVEMNEGLANRKSLRISRRQSRLSIPVLIQPVRNVENENPLEPAIHETMAQLVDMVVNQELQKKRAERRKFCREVIRYDPITPKVTRSGRKFANRTSVLFKKRQRLMRKSIRNQQSVQSTATAENVPEQTALEEKEPRFEHREVENQNLAQENAELVEEAPEIQAPVQLNGSPVVLVVQIRLSLEAKIEKENAKILEIEAERLKLAECSATHKLVEEIVEVENTEEMKEEKQNMIAVRRPRRNSMYPKMSINAVLEQEQLLAQAERENRKNRKRKSLASNQIPNEVNQIIQAQDEPSTSKAPQPEVPGAEINIVSREDEILEAPELHQSDDGIIETIEDMPIENQGENLEKIENPIEENKPSKVLIPANEMNQRRGRRRNSIYPRELLKTASIENLNEMVAENENDDQPEPEMPIELKNVNSDRKGKNKKNKKKRKEKRGSGEDQAENSENTPEAFVTDRKKNRKKRVIPEEDYHPSLKLPAPTSILKKEQLDTPKKRKNAVHWADDNNDAPLHSERRISDVPDEYRFRKSTYRSSNFYPDPY